MTYRELRNIHIKRCDMILNLYRDIAALHQKTAALKYQGLHDDITALMRQIAQLNKFEVTEFGVLLQQENQASLRQNI